MLAEYDKIFPGCAERLVKMAESQTEHRQGLESAVVHGNVANEKRGQVFAFILAMFIVTIGAAMIWAGKDLQGLTTIVTALATLAGVFIYGRRAQERERAAKRPT